MIQFNLLPDIKLQYIKARRFKRVLVTSAIGISLGCLVILFLLFSAVQFAQKKHINDLTKDIKSEVTRIQSVEDLDKILTIQNQLTTLPDLQRKKPLLSRLFAYISQTTPSNVVINKFDLDVLSSTMKISGTADTISTINTYADTLKFATFDSDNVKGAKPFLNVTTTLARDQLLASFSIDLTYDPLIFDGNEKVTLVVPDIVTTRSETEKPGALFEPTPTGEEQ